MINFDPISYDDVLAQFKKTERVHLLIGNGFSIACDKQFSYPALYDQAVENGLSKRAQALFEKMGTNNFEGVMHLLDNAHWVAHHYGLVEKEASELLADNELIKNTLVKSLCASHPTIQTEVPDAKKASAQKFLSRFHDIFCTNYDLLPYWVNMHHDFKAFQDGFRADIDDPELDYLVFSERGGSKRTLYYIHGGLHIYTAANGETRKLSNSRTQKPLMDLINVGLSKQEYPLFVAEGSASKKWDQIHQNSYLNYCFEKLGRDKGSLVIFGHSLGDSDTHIRNMIAENLELKKLFVGMFGSPSGKENLLLKDSLEKLLARRVKIDKDKKSPLIIQIFDSGSANVWGS